MENKYKDSKATEVDTVVIRFAGDSGDGMQITGKQFTETSAVLGNDVHTLPDFPAEIRAPAGTLHGVSGFQLSFSSLDIHTSGDNIDVLVAMNPAALSVNLAELEEQALIIVDSDKFVEREFAKSGIDTNPLEDNSLSNYRIVTAPITSLTLTAVEDLGLSRAKARKCKNMFALGIVFWLYNRPLSHTVSWLENKFQANPDIASANVKALKAGYNYAITAELFSEQYKVREANLPKGHYRQITGNEAVSLAIATAAEKSESEVLVAGYPITPSSDILHYSASYQAFGVKTFQAEDEMAAAGAALGAAYAGHLSLTCTSGPGLDLKAETIGLAVMTELPMVIVDVQRAGPSTGMPTKVEQADLLQAMYGRHGECPVPILAPSTPGDCFYTVLDAFKIAAKYMTPVIVLSDAYLANGAEPWLIPDVDKIDKINLKSKESPVAEKGDFKPYARDESLARPWVKPGTKGFEHRIGGLEKEQLTGKISYTPENHQAMVDTRLEKIEGIANSLPKLETVGDSSGDLLLITWGSNWGVVDTAVAALKEKGYKISYVNLRYLFPLQNELKDILNNFKQVVTVELNKGQLCSVLRAKYLKDVKSINKVTGKPFKVSEVISSCIKYMEVN